MVDAGAWKGSPRRWWHGSSAGMSGKQLVDFVKGMAMRYPRNVKVK
jgi:hypothetical protein